MTLGTMATDVEQRIDFDAMRKYRLQRARDQMEKYDLGALVCFDNDNIIQHRIFVDHRLRFFLDIKQIAMPDFPVVTQGTGGSALRLNCCDSGSGLNRGHSIRYHPDLLEILHRMKSQVPD